jgi:MATE family multidrug resistance protein
MKSSTALTPYPEGSIRELWRISFPLMISTFASLLMIFTDRIFLARYSLDALNASVNAGTLAWAIMGGCGMVTAMSEVFVAQYNGAGKFGKIGQPIWQMIWFAFLSLVLFVPLGIWGGPAFFGGDLHAESEIVYFRWMMFFGPSYALLMAFAGFFIGRGKTGVMILLAIAANVLNVLLDWVLIFGIKGWIPELGIQGAAIATCTGYALEASMLAYLFLRKKNREQFGTGEWRFDWVEMKRVCKVGIPQGIFSCLEVLGWSIFYWMMTSMSEKHITISSICQSFTILLSFFYDGLSRGAAAVAGNLIGASKKELIGKMFKSGTSLLAIFSLAIALFLVVDAQDTVRILFFEHFDGASSPLLGTGMQNALRTCMICAFVYLFFEGIRWLLSGILVAAGDTWFLLIAGSFSVWIFLLLPIYFFVVKMGLPVEFAWMLTTLYSALVVTIYWVRFKRGAWKENELVSQEPLELESD